jgi:hypothetical protein
VGTVFLSFLRAAICLQLTYIVSWQFWSLKKNAKRTRRYSTLPDEVDAARRYSTLLDATRCYSTLLDATRRYSTLLDATRRYSTLLDATRRYSTLLDATRRYLTILDATRLYSTLSVSLSTRILLSAVYNLIFQHFTKLAATSCRARGLMSSSEDAL